MLRDHSIGADPAAAQAGELVSREIVALLPEAG